MPDELSAEIALDRLYAAPPAEFTRTRNELVRALRETGRTADARALASRKKPTRVAYLLNELARRSPTEVERLIDVGRRLERAQRAVIRGGEADLRGVLADERKATQALLGRAAVIGRQLGVAAPRSEVAQALRAAIADPALGAAFEAGRLSTTPEPSGELALGARLATGGAAANEAPASEGSRPGPAPAPAKPVGKRIGRVSEVHARAEPARATAERVDRDRRAKAARTDRQARAKARRAERERRAAERREAAEREERERRASAARAEREREAARRTAEAEALSAQAKAAETEARALEAEARKAARGAAAARARAERLRARAEALG